ncbi:hypothetical protein [Streptomyces mobaraensis]|uniref:hypothetical protein n=1 Tax=Streptomyces mobaraensis TaxID=35621 RepID=UPI0012ACDA38|nr:hypothetical protein [Streptomyces mobaraensis]
MNDEREWAGTTEDRYALHRFGADQQARCDPSIRTYSAGTPRDAFREPYMTLRARADIEAEGFAHLYQFCPTCAGL